MKKLKMAGERGSAIVPGTAAPKMNQMRKMKVKIVKLVGISIIHFLQAFLYHLFLNILFLNHLFLYHLFLYHLFLYHLFLSMKNSLN